MKSVKEIVYNFIKSFIKGMGKEDVDTQDVQVNLSPDVQADLGALESVTYYAYPYMSKERKPNIANRQRVGMPNSITATMPKRQNSGKAPDGRTQPIRPIDERNL